MLQSNFFQRMNMRELAINETSVVAGGLAFSDNPMLFSANSGPSATCEAQGSIFAAIGNAIGAVVGFFGGGTGATGVAAGAFLGSLTGDGARAVGVGTCTVGQQQMGVWPTAPESPGIPSGNGPSTGPGHGPGG